MFTNNIFADINIVPEVPIRSVPLSLQNIIENNANDECSKLCYL